MADVIERKLRVEFEAAGIENVQGAVRDAKRHFGNLTSAVHRLAAESGDLEAAVKALSKEYLRTAQNAVKAMQKQNKAVRSATKDFNLFSRGVGEAGKAMKSLVLPVNFTAAVTQVNEYNKALLASASRMTRFGVGVAEMENRFVSLGKTLSFTRKETIGLFKAYESGFKFVSLQTFEKLLTNIRKAVGANAAEAQNLLGVVAGLSQKYPDLALQISKVRDESGKLNKDIANQLDNRSRALLLAQKVSDTEYRGIQAVLNAQRQLTPQDQKRAQQLEAQIKAMQDLRKHVEEVGIAFGQAILPHVERIAAAVSTLGENLKGMVTAAMTLGTVLAGAAALRSINTAVRGRQAAAVLGSPGRGGRVSGGRLGGGGTGMTHHGVPVMGGVQRVYVVNLPHSMRGAGPLGAPAPGAPGQPVGPGRSRPGRLGRLGRGLGKAAGGLGRGLSSPGALIGTLVAGAGLGYLENSLAGSGNIQGAGAARAGKGLVGVGGAAATGAMAGSFILPGIGTGIGAVVGALIGIASEFKSISSGLGDLFGGSDAAKVAAAKTERSDYNIRMRVNRQMEAKGSQKTTEQIVEQSIHMSAGELLENLRESEKQLKEMEKSAAKAQEEYEDMVDDAVKSTQSAQRLKDINELVAKTSERIRRMEGEGASKKALDAEKEVLSALEQRRDKIVDARAEVSNTNDKVMKQEQLVMKVNSQTEELKNKNQAYFDLLNKQQDVLNAVSALYGKQVEQLDAIVERMRITGNIDMGGLNQQVNTAIEGLQKQVDLRRTQNEIYQEFIDSGKKFDTDEERRKGRSEEVLKLMDEMNVSNLGRAAVEEKMMENENFIIKQKAAINKIALGSLDVHEGSINLAKAEASQMGKLVSLADSFAISVGASAKMRMDQFHAEERTIQTLTEQYNQLSNQIADGTNDTVEARTRLWQIESEITDAQTRQAQLVKSLRDGWISAIGAMNTGSGTFSKIIIDQNQAVAQSLKFGAVVSSKSGDFSRFGAGGNLLQEAGYRQSTRFSATPGGGVSFGKQTGGQGNFAYRTATGMDRSAEDSLVGSLRRMIGRKTGGQGASFQPTLAITGHPKGFMESAILQGANQGTTKFGGFDTGMKSRRTGPTRMELLRGGGKGTTVPPVSRAAGGEGITLVQHINIGGATITGATKQQVAKDVEKTVVATLTEADKRSRQATEKAIQKLGAA